MTRWTSIACVAVLGLAGCSSNSEPVVQARPADLVGLWRAEGPDLSADTYLRLDPDNRVFLFQTCGSPFGQWRAVAGGAMSVMLVVGAPDCPKIPGADEWERNTPPWLRAVSGARPDGARRILVDAAGTEIALLSPVPEAPGTDLPGERVAPHPPTPEQVGRLNLAEPPASGLRRARTDDLVGRWVPADRPEGVFVEFAIGGTLLLRDGCNFGRGRWAVGPAGALAAVLSLSYVVSCENAPIADWLQRAVWAAFDGVVLDLVGGEATVIGTLLKS